MLIIDNFTTIMPYIRCKLNKIVTYRHYIPGCEMIFAGVTKHFQGAKKGAKWGQNANYRQFHYGMRIFAASWTKSLYIVITDIPGQCEMKNIRYWGNQALPWGLKRGRNGAKMLIIDNFTTVMPYIRCKLNIIVTYRHYRYTWTVWNEKYSLLG